MAQFGMHEAKTTLSQLVERAEAGEEIIIARNGTPAVRLVPVVKTGRGQRPRCIARSYRDRSRFRRLPDDIAAAFGAR